jgi:glycosyltransferase involved in cell wall biosynthesis
MNIVIVAPCHVPLAIGGAEKLWWGLLAYLNGRTSNQADIIKLPGPERDFWEVVDSYRRFSELDLRHYDAVISGKYPAWMTDHPCHVCYMLHPLRGLYDTYPPNLPARADLGHAEVRALLTLVRSGADSREALAECFDRLARLRTPPPARWSRRRAASVPPEAFAFPGSLIREIVHFCDRVAFRPGAIRRFCAISSTVAGREGYFPPGAEVTAVHPPSDLTGYLRPRRGRYLFTVSRLDAPKRVDLLIEAMRHVSGDVELWIAGTGPDQERLRELSRADPRIRFLGFVNDHALLGLYSRAVAVLFAPVQEDFGLVALEAMAAGKPVITTADAGGPVELVQDGRTGFIVEPDPNAIAERIQRLLSERRLARRMGARARARAGEVTWERVGSALLDGIGS